MHTFIILSTTTTTTTTAMTMTFERYCFDPVVAVVVVVGVAP